MAQLPRYYLDIGTKKAGCLPLSILPYILLLNQLPQVSFNKEIVLKEVAKLATRVNFYFSYVIRNIS
jgi:hypothetical protein